MSPLLRKILAALGHPLSLVSLGVLLLNDHLFRVLQPSWLTGKLGDAAWLFFAPLVLLLLLALITRKTPLFRKNEILLPLIAYGSVGGLFILGNSSPGFAGWLAEAGGRVFGFPWQIVCDPTDLLALPFLATSYFFWRRFPEPSTSSPSRKLAGAAAALMGAALTLANSAAPQYGVDGLAVSEDGLTACSAYEDYVSTDGGLTWQVDSVGFSGACSSGWDDLLAVDWQGEEWVLRYNQDAKVIESSTDRVTWKSEYVLQPPSQAGQALFAKENSGNIQLSQQGPYAVVFDPDTGNVVIAMGLDGVLVRSPDGTWQQVAVGVFSPRKVNSLHSFYTLLSGELVLALGLGLLLLGTAGAKLLPKLLMILPLILGWMGWTLSVWFKPALYSNYPIPLSFVLLASALFIVPVGVVGLVQLIRRRGRTLVLGLMLAVDGCIFFLVPFILWALDLIPSYLMAMLVSAALALVDVAAVLLLTKTEPVLAS